MDTGLTFHGTEHVKWRYFLTVFDTSESSVAGYTMSFPFPLFT